MSLPELLAHLGRGGDWQYFWRADRKVSTWFPAGQPPAFPTERNLYFGVHPTRLAGSSRQRSTKATICALNCLFAEFDCKDFAGDLAQTLWSVEHLRIPPSVCIASGGGYHAYWLLPEPEPVTEASRGELEQLQAAWVETVGGDEGAKDTARVLRVPGTLNAKYDPPRPVNFAWFVPDYLPLFALRQHVATFGPAQRAQPGPNTSADIDRARSRTPEGYRARAYGLAAMQRELDALAATASGSRNRRLNEAALKLGSLVGGGLLQHGEALRGLANTALSMGTDSSFAPAQIKATIKSGFEAGLNQPRGVPDGAR